MTNTQQNNTTTTSHNDSEASLLDQLYVYQNKTTGAPSSTTLTVRQLCRILCPALQQTNTIQSNTLVLRYDPIQGEYDTDWKPASQTSILKEACTLWYYSSKSTQQESSQNANVEGPVSCRVLAKKIKEGTLSMETTRVYGSSHQDTNQTRQSWKLIQELPGLKVALTAFDTPPPPAEWNLNKPNTVGTEKATTNGSFSKQQYDASVMTFQDDVPSTTDASNSMEPHEKQVQDELEAFLSSTASGGPEQEEGYTSDGGTPYVKCPQTGHYVHADDVITKKRKEAPTHASTKQPLVSKKRKKSKFAAKHSKCWIYVTGLPHDCNEEQVSKFFTRVGILDLHPETQLPKIKLYRHKDGTNRGRVKGDASVCFARPESVDLALQLLDETPFRLQEDNNTRVIRVQRAKFEQHGKVFEKTKSVSNSKRKVAKLAAIQAMDWDEDTDNGRISGGRKGLCIVVLKHMFDPTLFSNDDDKAKQAEAMEELQKEIHDTCREWGTVEKITVFSQHVDGIVILKFVQPTAASRAIQEYNGKEIHGRQVKASFWDGVTDYTVRDEVKERADQEKRHDEFGAWLENQQLPQELQLQVEGGGSKDGIRVVPAEFGG